MTQDQILLKLCRQVRDAFATAVAALEENEKAAAEAAAPDLFLEALKGEPEHVTATVPAKQEEQPREVKHRTPLLPTTVYLDILKVIYPEEYEGKRPAEIRDEAVALIKKDLEGGIFL